MSSTRRSWGGTPLFFRGSTRGTQRVSDSSTMTSVSDTLNGLGSDDASLLQTDELTTMPKTKALRDETKYRLLPPSMPKPTPDSKPTLPSTASKSRSSVMRRATSWTALPGRRSPKNLATNAHRSVVKGLTEQEKRSQVRALNLARRQLDQWSKRQIIADELKENPRRSNNWIAKSLGVDDKTVASVRRKCNQLRKSRSWVTHWVQTASTALRPGAACR